MLDKELLQYESPIQIFQNGLTKEFDNHVLKVVQNIGIEADKAQLIEALAYDRNQYKKGYINGVKEFANMLKEKISNIERYDFKEHMCCAVGY